MHLVAIDETRKAFRPVLMNVSNKIEEIWFAGVHSDVGGGYYLDGLSDISLEFMIKRASHYGLTFFQSSQIDFNNLEGKKDEQIEEIDVAIKPDINTNIHKHVRDGKLAALTLAARKICKVVDDKPSDYHLPIVHHSVMKRCKVLSSYQPSNLRGSRHYVIDENDSLNEYGGLEDYEC